MNIFEPAMKEGRSVEDTFAYMILARLVKIKEAMIRHLKRE